MRQLKFRVWDNFYKDFNYIDDLYWFEENYVHNSEDANIEQFTGMKDCNGVDIYENDLIDFEVRVLYEEYDQMKNQKVEYDQELGMFVFGEKKWCMADHITDETIKVTGHIYEQ